MEFEGEAQEQSNTRNTFLAAELLLCLLYPHHEQIHSIHKLEEGKQHQEDSTVDPVGAQAASCDSRHSLEDEERQDSHGSP